MLLACSNMTHDVGAEAQRRDARLPHEHSEHSRSSARCGSSVFKQERCSPRVVSQTSPMPTPAAPGPIGTSGAPIFIGGDAMLTDLSWRSRPRPPGRRRLPAPLRCASFVVTRARRRVDDRSSATAQRWSARFQGCAANRPARRAPSGTPRMRNAMRKVAARFPADIDAQTLFADAMLNLRPWNQWTRDGKPQPGTLELVGVLERGAGASAGTRRRVPLLHSRHRSVGDARPRAAVRGTPAPADAGRRPRGPHARARVPAGRPV